MKDPFINRRYILAAITIIASLALLARIFYIQIVDKSYSQSAVSNVIRNVTRYPARGLIYDRNGDLVVFNQAAYDIMVIPFQTSEIDTVAFCDIIGITKESFIQRLAAASSYSRFAPSVFLRQVSSETYASLQEVLFRYPGFYVQTRNLRDYALPVAAHLLGYVGEVDESVIARDSYYRAGDYYGVSGLERSYEDALRGAKGVSVHMVDVNGRVVGPYRDGNHDREPVPGKDIVTTIDLRLQEYGEKLMKNKRGSVVAIEPSTGEILALVTAPSYDPSLLVGRVRSQNFQALRTDTLNPLFNRALMAAYPPGSAFKPVVGLIALQEGVITPTTEFGCAPGYLFVGCRHHPTPLALAGAIMYSCNAYFCQAFRRIMENSSHGSVSEAYKKWYEYLSNYGFGQQLGTDLVNELSGFIPKTTYYDRYHGEGRWRALTIISLAIGQGEILATPLQMANATAAIANRGFYYTPHIVKQIGDDTDVNDLFRQKNFTGIDSLNHIPVIDGMDMVVSGGEGATARHISIPGIEICGKTGTVQNPHGENHSVFIAFAPKDNPQIAIAVYIENAGYGSTYAAPLASLMIEKYLTREVKNRWRENHILEFGLPQNEEEY